MTARAILAECYIVAVLCGLLAAFSACELTDEKQIEQDAEIRAWAEVANAELARDFDCAPLDLEGIEMTWSTRSCAHFGGRKIEIDEECRGTTRAYYPIKHELFHALSGLPDSAPCWRGKSIALYVPAWAGRGECE